jgi:hypothetical protein
MRFKAKYKWRDNQFDEIRMNLDLDKFLDNLVLHADADIDWALNEKIGTYERLGNMLLSRNSHEIVVDIYPFGKWVEMAEHARNVYTKRMQKALDKIAQIADISFK